MQRSDVVIGRNGHLFHRADGVFEQVCDGATLDAADLARWQTLIEQRVTECRDIGARYVMLVVPEKHGIYEDRLPAGRRITRDRPALRIHAALDASLRPCFVYPAVPLREGRRVEKTYYVTDARWTDFGAYIAYRALLRALAQRMPMAPIDEIELRRFPRPEFCGELGALIDPQPTEERIVLEVARPDTVHLVCRENIWLKAPVHVFINTDHTLPRAVIFRDENLLPVMPFLLRHFSRTVVVGNPHTLPPDLLEAEKPDLVLTALPERHLATPTPDGPIRWPTTPTTFATLTGRPLPLP
jgi:alginate O-acetyltransferase complex protein AlgJ